jgi:hypothetical protein
MATLLAAAVALTGTTARRMPARVRVASLRTAPPRMAQLSEVAAAAVAASAGVKRKQRLEMPRHLSPSTVTAFKECPQSFLFRSLWKLPEPPSPVLWKGTLVHEALEKIFDLPPEERRARLHETLRDAWRKKRLETHPATQQALVAR